MAGEVLRLALAGVLIASAVAKLASPASSAAALDTFGIPPGARRAVWTALVALELALAVGVATGLDAAAYAAALLMGGFGAALLLALRRGMAGAPCACFGSRSKVSRLSVARNMLLACAFAAVPLVPVGHLSTDQWLGLGLGISLLLIAGLVAAVLALAREVGMLRLRLGPAAALEIEHEGPPLGQPTGLIERIETAPRTELALAVFSSEGCHICRSLEPAVSSLAREPFLAVATFSEQAEPGLWSELGIPGSPYGIALGLDGAVLAKGTFNSLAQLESILATAEQRRARSAEAAHA
jgi:hypothetical protein